MKSLWNTRAYALDAGLLVLRIGLAAMMIPHGWGKFTHYAERAAKFPDPLGVGSEVSLLLTIFAELICSCLLLAGLFTRFVLIPLMFTMVVVILIIHAKDALSVKEHAILFLVPYILLFLSGPGRYSADALLKK